MILLPVFSLCLSLWVTWNSRKLSTTRKARALTLSPFKKDRSMSPTICRSKKAGSCCHASVSSTRRAFSQACSLEGQRRHPCLGPALTLTTRPALAECPLSCSGPGLLLHSHASSSRWSEASSACENYAASASAAVTRYRLQVTGND